MSRKRTVRPAEIFLSHSSKNVRFAHRLAKALEAHGVNSFFSKKNIHGAQEWHDEIGAALKRCDWFLLVLSPDAIRSTWVKRELVFVLQEQRFEERILPVLYKTCDAGRIIMDAARPSADRFPERLPSSVPRTVCGLDT
jgi:hypothetical protein